MENMDGVKAAFCRSLDWRIDIRWCDLTGIHEIDEDRRAVITLMSSTVHDHFDGFGVEIVSKQSGKITSKFLRFNDYLSARVDSRKDYSGFCVISHTGWGWYIAEPAAKARPFCEAIETYIAAWR